MLAANRRNARRSTGPTRAGGRWNASQNALQHGHYARSLRRSMLARRENATDLLLRLKAREAAAGDAKKSRNEGRSHDVIENKGPATKSHDVPENKGDT